MSSSPAITTVTRTHTVTIIDTTPGPTASPPLEEEPFGRAEEPRTTPETPPYPFTPPQWRGLPDDGWPPFYPYLLPEDIPHLVSASPPDYSDYVAGRVMDPLTAILSIFIVSLMYWGFKNGGIAGLLQQYQASNAGSEAVVDENPGGDAAKKSSSSRSSHSKEKDE
ncbi:hypothetical protein NliqN6_6852 [Naganishia liquefaciens]|uniref:Uncharacterized protein n=1 Tax=Naganishia liquefaciens TaxID=104408 RepID=A0A8H3U0T2_9TREE|nr:hypothetical protein NliqN6_6852 [Naganishia liquefaciens]